MLKKVSKRHLAVIKKGQSGFTLIELMVVMSIMAIVSSIALPSLSQQMANQRVKSTAQSLASALKEAKVESVIRRKNVTVTTPESSSTDKVVVLATGTSQISTYPVSEGITIRLSEGTQAEFTAQKRALNAITYTICDSNSTEERPLQVLVDTLANVQIKREGTC